MNAVGKAAVWAILVEECGADPAMWGQFKAVWPKCGEFRFQGSLGFGGKLYHSSNGHDRVDCYPEDATPERRTAIVRANARLRELAEAEAS